MGGETAKLINLAPDEAARVLVQNADEVYLNGLAVDHNGGNGINVARALTELGVPVHCCSTIGGESGDLLLRLLGDTLGDNHNWFRLQGETRLNTNIMQQNPPGQFEITSLGPEVPADVLAGITDCFLSMQSLSKSMDCC